MPNPATAEATTKGSRYLARLAVSEADIERAQLLRYRVFGDELGARLHSEKPGLDSDYYDRFCHHLIVCERESGQVVGATRILTDTQARTAGGFYSESEFELGRILGQPGRFMEVGRTCVDSSHRNGAIIGMLWQGLATFMELHRFDFLMGCASIPLQDGGQQAQAIMHQLRARHWSPEQLRALPRRPLPEPTSNVVEHRPPMPPLLKAYMRIGAYVCGEPCWDPDFRVADVFILLSVDNLKARYVRHFMRRPGPARPAHANAANYL